MISSALQSISMPLRGQLGSQIFISHTPVCASARHKQLYVPGGRLDCDVPGGRLDCDVTVTLLPKQRNWDYSICGRSPGILASVKGCVFYIYNPLDLVLVLSLPTHGLHKFSPPSFPPLSSLHPNLSPQPTNESSQSSHCLLPKPLGLQMFGTGSAS